MSQYRVVVDEVGLQYRARIVREVPRFSDPYRSSPRDLEDSRLIDVEKFPLCPNRDLAQSRAKDVMFEKYQKSN